MSNVRRTDQPEKVCQQPCWCVEGGTCLACGRPEYECWSMEQSREIGKLQQSLKNVLGLVSRGRCRKEPRITVEEMDHLIRFCKEGGVEPSILRKTK